ncbi:MAG: HAMP domain-containing histidine kinase [Clostridia bacterium]|nr:HAMP domain-containing histidine kinase [Clostridia bacterium]
MRKAAERGAGRRLCALLAVFFCCVSMSAGSLRHMQRTFGSAPGDSAREQEVIFGQFAACMQLLAEPLRSYFENPDAAHPECPAALRPENSNFRFSAYDSAGNVILDTADNSPVRAHQTQTFELTMFSGADKPQLRTQQVTIECYLCRDLTADDNFSRALHLLWMGAALEDTFWAVSVVAGAVAIVFALLAMRCTLREAGSALRPRGIFAALPPDLYLCCVLPAAVFFARQLGTIREESILRSYIHSGTGAYRLLQRSLCTTALIALGLFLTLLVLYSVRRSGWRGIFSLKRFERVPFTRRAIVYLVVMQCVKASAIALYMYAYTRWVVLFLLLEKAVTLPVIYRMLRQSRTLAEQTAQFVGGDLSGRAQRERDYATLAQHGADIDTIVRRISASADEYIQSSNFKAELITNLSHDIKTPLTSIISYAQLLSQDDLSDADRKQYLDVLRRHSARLQKLLEDLTDVSDAASGKVQAQMQAVDLCALITQSAAGFEERLQKRGITVRFVLPDEPLFAAADAHLLWRVADNLMNNICKYAAAGSQVQIALLDRGDSAAVIYRNRADQPIRLSGEALMERFVRADSARTTDGSGLGLSIAHSLLLLQGGRLALHTEGDVFTAQVLLRK